VYNTTPLLSEKVDWFLGDLFRGPNGSYYEPLFWLMINDNNLSSVALCKPQIQSISFNSQ